MKPIPILSLGFSLLLAGAAHAQVPPDKAVATMQVVDGLQIELFAAEPMLVNPTSIDVDHRGRVWVCEAVNYRRVNFNRPILRPEGDRIVILEDTTGSGKADKSTVFYQGKDLYGPMGIAVAKDPVGPGWKVYVGQSPDILVFEDKDGDGKADGPPKKLLSGFKGFDHDHGVHGLTIGPDGKLYFSVGDQGVKDLQSSDGKGRKWTTNHTDCQAGTIWRCNLDGTNLELIAHNFRNEYKPCVDSFGNIFVSDNDDDGNQQTRICYVMPGGNYGYWPRGPGQTHWHEEQPGVVPKILRTYFGSPTGMCVYEGTLLPKKYQGQLLHTDAGPRHVRCYHLTPDGAGFTVEREDLVTSTDNWFRPSDIVVAPDGSVLVADWYDPGVGGHGMGDWTRGRIFRITPKGHKGYRVPEVEVTTKRGLAAALDSPSLSARYMATAKLQHIIRTAEKPQREALDLLELAVADERDAFMRARTLWQLSVLDELFERSMFGNASGQGGDCKGETGMQTEDGAPLWKTRAYQTGNAARDIEPRFRELAIRSWFARRDANVALRDAPAVLFGQDSLKALIGDRSAAVRREALLALRACESLRAKPLIVELAKLYDGKDRFYLAAIGIAVGHYDKERRDIILADFDKHFPELNDKTLDLIWELRPPTVVARLEKEIGNAKLTAGQRARIVDILAASDDVAAGKALLRLLSGEAPEEVKNRAVETLRLFLPGKWTRLTRSEDFDATLNQLLAKSETRAAGLQLVAAAKFAPAVENVARLASAHDLDAIRTLGQLPRMDAVTQLVKLHGTAIIVLRASKPSADTDKAALAVAVEAVSALGPQVSGAADSPASKLALTALQQSVTAPDEPIEVQQAALAALAGSRPGSAWLLQLKEKNELPAKLVGDTGRLLRNSPFQPVRNKALTLFPPPPAGKIDPKKLPAIASLAVRKGDVGRGESLIAASAKTDTLCLKCHTIRGVGGQIGPDLTTIGKKASRENLFESILYPSKAIADQFLSWQIETKQGLSLIGLIVEEKPDSVTLRDANGKDTKIAKADIDSRTKSPNSLMSSDLVAYLSEEDLVDIVEYLMTLKD
jgi:putative membrane-bound dehydrogenase-like protein